jgi:hypothetical protein
MTPTKPILKNEFDSTTTARTISKENRISTLHYDGDESTYVEDIEELRDHKFSITRPLDCSQSNPMLVETKGSERITVSFHPELFSMVHTLCFSFALVIAQISIVEAYTESTLNHHCINFLLETFSGFARFRFLALRQIMNIFATSNSVRNPSREAPLVEWYVRWAFNWELLTDNDLDDCVKRYGGIISADVTTGEWHLGLTILKDKAAEGEWSISILKNHCSSNKIFSYQWTRVLYRASICQADRTT